MPQYPPSVEQWRPLVKKYFPPELVDKALWVIMYESGGNPNRPGDGGVARGLFQIQDNRRFRGRPPAQWLDNPENNIRYAAQVLGAAKNKWSDWGEGSLYNGKRFGALGNHPYPGNKALNSRGSTSSGIQYTGGSDMALTDGETIFDRIGNRVESTISSNNSPSQEDDGGGFFDSPYIFDDGSGVDHFFDVNPLDAEAHQLNLDLFEYQQKKDAWYAQQQQAEFAWQQATDERDYALAVGEYDLARQKAVDANHWQKQSLMLELQIANMDAQMQAYQINMSYQAEMARATNDADANRINLAREQELAAIAKMQDETNRAIAGKQLNISAYDSETNRMLGLGELAIENNKFIHELYSNPRNHFSLFAMQRGNTPDWDTMAATGQLPGGDPLRVRDPFSMMDPTVTLPTDFNIGPGQSHGQVGQASQGVNLQGISQYQNMPMQNAPQLNMDFGDPQQVTPTPLGGSGQYTDINPGGAQGGVPTALLKPGLNLSTVGAVNGQGIYGNAFSPGLGSAYYDQGMSRPIQPGDYLAPGTQIWYNYTAGGPAAQPNPYPQTQIQSNANFPSTGAPQANQVVPGSGGIPQYGYVPGPEQGNLPSEYVPGLPAYAQGTSGMVNDPVMMTGDAPNPNPYAGGARPEIIVNPTQAPIGVINTEQTQAIDYGGRGYQMPGSTPGPTTAPPSRPKDGTAGMPGGTPGPTTAPPTSIPGPVVNQGGMMGGFQNILNRFMPQMQNWQQQFQQYQQQRNSPEIWNGTRPNVSNTWFQTHLLDYGIPNSAPDQNVGYNTMYQPPYTMQTPGGQQAGAYSNAPNTSVNQNNPIANQYGFLVNRYRQGLRNTPNERPANGQIIGGQVAPRFAYGTMPRYATGTYTNDSGTQQHGGGGDPMWIQSSSNPWAQGMQNIPHRAQMLMDYGMPMSPATLGAISGNVNSPLNTSAAVQGRGGGILPSLQTLRGMSTSELGNLQGYYEGPVGIGWSDIVDYITGATRGLGRAQSSGGIR